MANTANVTAAKPRIAGAVMYAELSAKPTIPTSAPASASDANPTGFTSLGYVSDNGVANNNSSSSTQVRAWGGNVVLTTEGEKNDTFKFTLLEVLNPDVLKVVHGESNVTGMLETGITVKVNNLPKTAKAWIIDILMTGGVLKRIVIPNGTISEVSEVTYKDNEAVGYEVTVQGMPDEDGQTHYEYIKGTATA